jgi:2-polyprenyl-3-methyl-5-hydroxy-6-metoxy-1,4-benzoquinol methylase
MAQDKVDYNTWHASHSVDDDINTPWHRFIKNKLRHFASEGSTILEIGCGRGGFSNYLANTYPKSHQIVASDFSNEGLRIAHQKFGDYNGLIQWKQEDIMSQSFANNSFDLAISCETIEHIPHPKKAISELYRVLKPGGLLLLTCPSYFNLFGIWCLYRWLIGKPFTEGGQPYVNYIQMPKIYYFIKRSGFKVIEWKASEIIIPARVPKHFWNDEIPGPLKVFGHRTYYVLKKLE